MSPREPDFDDPDDFFKDTRMSLGDHIEELRMALWRALKGFFVAVILAFFVADRVMNFISAPVERQLMVFYNKRVEKKKEELKQEMEKGGGPLETLNRPKEVVVELPPAAVASLARRLGLDLAKLQPEAGGNGEESLSLPMLLKPVQWAIILDEATRVVGHPPLLVALSITEAFVIWMKVGIYTGIVLASPWIFWQIWMFIGAGLYPHEKKLVHYYLPLSLGLFLGGVVLCEFVVLPIGISYLLSFNEWLRIEPDLRLSEWLSFAILMPLIFGIAFQLPLVMYFLDRVGIVSVEIYVKYWRIAIFILVILSALLQVSTDPFSMMAMAIPMCLLYVLGIMLCKLSPRPAPDLEVPDPEEMVEV
jgi:sec-independent protein translocase protein TatC